ncbi:hypothetical protein [Chitinimonas koreensis]|uniref:hypothetical protein n=1 Tax=Chitinimonas koreensis TaxID=356302 RepID=UPI00146FBA3B|nr:hypothetical protein [Chitinimonas koreensis]QNM98690.1 hypothetical protein H9L41_10970 [Chitinimonas koreensis]
MSALQRLFTPRLWSLASRAVIALMLAVAALWLAAAIGYTWAIQDIHRFVAGACTARGGVL